MQSVLSRQAPSTLGKPGNEYSLNSATHSQQPARAVFFNRLGEIRDCGIEQQRFRASCLNFITAAIVLWNTIYLQRALAALREQGHSVDDTLHRYLSPLGCEYVNLTGDHVWHRNARVGAGKFRLLLSLGKASRTIFSVF